MSAPAERSADLTLEIPERRRSVRKPHVAQAYLASPTGGGRIEVSSVDISRHGVGLNLAIAIPSETFHILELGVGPHRIVTEVRILTCRKHQDGSYRANAAFC